MRLTSWVVWKKSQNMNQINNVFNAQIFIILCPSSPTIMYNYISYIFTAAARRALVVIMSKCVSFCHSVILSFCHVTFSRPLIGRKYHRHWGRGRWAPRRQNIVEAIHVNEKEIKRGWTELCHTRNQTQNKKMSPPKFTYSGRICRFAQFLELSLLLILYSILRLYSF